MRRRLAVLLIVVSTACGDYVPPEPEVWVEVCPKGWEIVTEAYGGFSSGEKTWCEMGNLKTDARRERIPLSELERMNK